MPESQHTEWKERWRDEYLAQVCGFANAQGGTLVIGHTWDGAPLPGVTPDDLSPAAFKRFRQLALRSRRLDEESLADSNAGLLDRLKLAEGAYLKRAAVLLFHPDPSRHFTGAFVKIGYFEHDAHIRYHDLIEGDLFTQARQAQDVLLLKYLKASVRYEREGEGLLRVERYPVPREALREALLNALIHRDYASTAPVQIRVYDDKLILWNPATLPPGWTEQTLLQPHISLPHNPDVANAFFRAGEIEAWGRGIERIFAACRAEHAPEPELKLHSGGLWLEFPYDPAYLRMVKQGSSEATDPVADPVTDPVTPEVTRVLELLTNETMPPSVIQQRLGLKHRPTFRANYLHPALEAGLIEMTLPDKPNSRLQKYRLTVAGRRILQAQQPADSESRGGTHS